MKRRKCATDLNRELISKTEQFLHEHFESKKGIERDRISADYRVEHSYRVANIGRRIAEKEGLDETAMVIACLLHDVAYCRELNTPEEQRGHGRLSAQIARPFLQTLELTEEQVNDICYGIAIHVDDEADFKWHRSTFAETVSDADNIDRFDAYRIYEGLYYAAFHEMTWAEKKGRVDSMLQQLEKLKDFPMATATARELWQQRLAYYRSFYERLRDQLAISSEIL